MINTVFNNTFYLFFFNGKPEDPDLSVLPYNAL